MGRLNRSGKTNGFVRGLFSEIQCFDWVELERMNAFSVLFPYEVSFIVIAIIVVI
jgi:hypothetical protein